MLILNLQADFDTNLPNFFDGLLVSDATLSDGRRIVLFTSKESLKFFARSDCIASSNYRSATRTTIN